ncbi:MAG TPA: thiamine diphosphokinase [Bacteroidetes bacterium]|nr:thiamine diphosphokinase [Bacteroidota bacterium]
MSSHHVVKDKQEPALIIANGESCSMELLGQLLEWSPTVLVLDGAAHKVEELGIKIDVLLGDFDRISDLSEFEQRQQPVRIIHTPDQNATDLEKAIEWLIQEGYPSANIIWATGKRADHTVNNMMSLFKYSSRIDLVMLDDYSRIFSLPKAYKKWYPAETIISLIPFGLVKGVSIKGLEYLLNNEDLESGIRSGSSNRVSVEGWIEIDYREGNLLLMECRD